MKKYVLTFAVLGCGLCSSFSQWIEQTELLPVSAWESALTNAPVALIGGASSTGSGSEPLLSSEPPEVAMAMSVPAANHEGDLVETLADQLDGDLERMFDYVRLKIQTEPYLGLIRSPQRTLLDGAGSPMEQAHLLARLIKEENSSAVVGFQRRNVWLPLQDDDGFDVCEWMGTTNYLDAVNLLKLGGLHVSVEEPIVPSSELTFVQVRVAVYTSEGWYYFDPSLKTHVPAEVMDFGTLSGYSRTNLLAVAGGTTHSDGWATGLQEGAITNLLHQYAVNLREALAVDAEPPGDAGRIIPSLRHKDGPYSTATGYTSILSTNIAPANVHGKIIWSFNEAGSVAIPTYDFSHTKHSIRFPTGSPYLAHIYYGGKSSEPLVEAGSGGSYGDSCPLTVKTVCGGITNTQHYTLRRGMGNYVLCQSFGGGCSSGMSEYINKNITAIKQLGWGDATDEVITENLRYTGQRWMDQQGSIEKMLSLISPAKKVVRYKIGMMAGETDGFYIDAKNGYNFSAGDDTGFLSSYIVSALEHAVLEQLQPGNAEGVSTIRIIKQANAADMPIYRADSNNWANIEGDLSGYDTAEIGGSIATNQGFYILPKSDSVAMNDDWSGMGYVSREKVPGGTSYGMMIDGDFNGGYNISGNWYDVSIVENITSSVYSYQAATTPPVTSIDPVDMKTGAFLFDHTDLTIDGPLPLVLHRSYRSDNTVDSGMGPGWTHSFNIRASEHAAINEGLGERTLADATPLLTGMAVIEDLLANETEAKDWVAAAIVADWAAQQLINNGVSITLGGQTITFVRQPDGTYTAPPGMTHTLSKTNGVYVMSERHGNTYTFDANLNIETITDPASNTLSFVYNNDTNLYTVASSFGPTFTFGYTSNLLSSVSDGTGRSISYQYDWSNNNLTNFVDAGGEDWGIAYDDDDHPHAITTLTDPEQIDTIENRYNDFGQVYLQYSASGRIYKQFVTDWRSTEEDPLGNETTHYYDHKGRVVETVRADGLCSTKTYDAQDRIIQTISEAGVTNIFVYDEHHNLLAQTNALGTAEAVATHYGYDNEHHLRVITNALGTAEQTVTEITYTASHKPDIVTEAKGTALETETDYNYNTDGLLQQVSEGNGTRITTYSNFDSYGNAQTVTSTDAGTLARTFNARGDLTSQTVDGKTTAFGYNALRNPVVVTNALGTADQVVTLKTYYDNGLLKQETDGRQQATEYFWTPAYKQAGMILPNLGNTTNLYDEADRLVASHDAEGNWVTNTLDSVGRPVSVSSVYSVVSNQFDAVGNLTNSIVDPDGLNLWSRTEYDNLNRLKKQQSAIGSQQFFYDPLGRTTNRMDQASKHWKTEYDALGRVKKTFRPSENYEEYGYDKLGNRTHFWNADRNPITFGVDAQGRVTAITNAISKVTQFDFDDAGNLDWRISGEQEQTDYDYDNLNRLTNVVHESVWKASFDHDDNGNIVEQASPLAQVQFGYDDMNSLKTSTQSVYSVSSVVHNSYDLNGNRTNIVYPGGLTVSYEFGADNRLESVTTEYSNNTKTISFGYDTANRMDSVAYPNGVNSTFGLDAAGRITNIVHGTFVNRQIIRNPLGFKTTELINAGIKPTVPETARRLKTHNDADQLVSERIQRNSTNWTDVVYSYNDNGGLRYITEDSIVQKSYEYDYDNRLTAADGVEYLYDAVGSRVGRVSSHGATLTTNYFVIDYTDGLKRPLAETDSSGNITRYYVWSGANLLCHIEANGDTYYYHSDELGSTLAITDGNGAVTDEFAYMPYGYATHTAHSGSVDTPFQWLGGYGVYYDIDTELHLTLHRAYSCSLKRFISPDPLGIDGGVNVYAMANLNPLFFVDPYGLCADSAGASWENNSWYDRARAPIFMVQHNLGEYVNALDNAVNQFREATGIATADRWMESNVPGYAAVGDFLERPEVQMGMQAAMMTMATPNTGTTVYRGVRPTHPGYRNATQGIAKPRRSIFGHKDPVLHNAGNTKSKFTSWTTDRNVAKRFSGSDGVILETTVPESRLIFTPDKFQEAERLILGPVRGATVTRP